MRSIPRLRKLLRFREQELRAVQQELAAAEVRLSAAEAVLEGMKNEQRQHLQASHSAGRLSLDAHRQLQAYIDWIAPQIEESRQTCEQRTADRESIWGRLVETKSAVDAMAKLLERSLETVKQKAKRREAEQREEFVMTRYMTASMGQGW